jgi:transposase
MEETLLFDLPEGLQVSQIHITEQGLVVEVVATSPMSRCPACLALSDSIHCHYCRGLCDVPCVGRRVQLCVTVRKFTCHNPHGARKVFAEQIPAFVKPRARMTIRYSEHITALGLATSGQAGARLAARLGMVTTRQTILRRIMDLPDSLAESVLFLGIDDFAFLRGRRFGTILVNLKTRHVVDLLPDRKAETAASWMRQYPDLMAVSRDRGGDYAAAAKASAPQATQYANRFHVIKNLGEALEGVLARHLAAYRTRVMQESRAIPLPIAQEKGSPNVSLKQATVSQAKREERLAQYEHVVALRKQSF